MRGRVLVIAGSDSGGGAGIQADIKTITALDGFAMTAVTALTAQNTLGVHGVFAVPPQFVREQIGCVLSDIGADVIKVGMLGDAALIEEVAAVLEESATGIPVVLDPVMVAKGGAPLLAVEALGHLKRRLVPLADVLTPNVPEAEALAGIPIPDADAMAGAATALRSLGASAVLLKGGHLAGPQVIDLLVTDGGVTRFRGARIETRHTHGTGCTLASALAVSLAQGLPMKAAVVRARAYVRDAIASAPGFGHGHGPLNHAVPPPVRDAGENAA
ncbi:MAG TPA: bifunctional hydroxymethylpyrimidine kinase/phosphomethylpyrimidine kinase [Acetobacteraceae bacterium]|jgi:hydroxymethylpyrimidine/phosphomethylpyrimidine kinase|nr:bifunctional hydroxymethylpyrimidine kinase/phosphomethylpyrimidine kinase [Acetobacteraceae bacterium]